MPAFARGLHFDDLPGDVVRQARRCLLDLAGVAAAGTTTPVSGLVRDYVADQMGGGKRSARMLFDGRRAGLAGAALSGATTIDSVDGHDGHPLTKGHAGVAVLPALLAFVDGDPHARERCDGRELLTSIVLGYEIATRAGIALHASAPSFHSSGAWNAIAAAAIGARLLGLPEAATRHALGIAEYWGPRGEILRVCDYPTMLKDGSSAGAQAGVAAALLATQGYTGAPALTIEGAPVATTWGDLGERWRIREQYFKPWPVCRWAQPAMQAALALARTYEIGADDVAEVVIESFAEAVALGSRCPVPTATDEAQYSITWPVAAALVYGDVGVEALCHVTDARVARLLSAIRLVEAPDLSQRFPAERYARVTLTLRDGRVLASPATAAHGSAEDPMSDAEIDAKYAAYAAPILGAPRASRIAATIAGLPDDAAADALVDELLAPIP